MGIPLHIALRGIEKAFDSWESKPRKRSVKSLIYCQEEVEAQFAEWREARVGAADPEATGDTGADSNDERLPFSRTAIVEHLQRGHSGLLAARAAHAAYLTARDRTDDDFSDALTRATGLLAEIEADFSATARPEAQRLEQSLTGLERMLSDAVGLVVEAEALDRIKREVKEQLRPYRKQMEKEIYDQTFENLLLKRLREHFGVPRLSLFYI